MPEPRTGAAGRLRGTSCGSSPLASLRLSVERLDGAPGVVTGGSDRGARVVGIGRAPRLPDDVLDRGGLAQRRPWRIRRRLVDDDIVQHDAGLIGATRARAEPGALGVVDVALERVDLESLRDR